MVLTLNTNVALEVFSKTLLIRAVEMEISDRYSSGLIRCPTHLSIGQEITPSALGLLLRPTDFAVSTHRSHAHYLAKGGDLRAMVAELYGLEEGCSRGRGGSMHLVDQRVGFMGSSAIVGNSIPVGTGLGLAQKFKGNGGVSVVYLGDAAVEEGVFVESVNFAVTQKLPVLFVCENNGYSVYSGFQGRQPVDRNITDLVAGIGISVAQVNAFDIQRMLDVFSGAVEASRTFSSPAFIEIDTERAFEHCGPGRDDHLDYRDRSRSRRHEGNDPHELLTQFVRRKVAYADELIQTNASLVKKVFDEIEAAARKLASSPGAQHVG